MTTAVNETLSSISSERITLACLLKDQGAWLGLPEAFSSDDFSHPLNKSIFLVIDHLYSSGGQPDPISISEALDPGMRTELDQVGGWGYISALKDMPVDPQNISIEARKLIELGTRRRIVAAGDKIMKLAPEEQPIDKVIEKVEVAVSEIEGRDGVDAKPIGSISLEFIEKKMANPTEVPGLSSGFDELDKSLLGFQPGRLYVIGARKKTGKSILLLNWAKHLSVDMKTPILWISNEHSQEDELSRLLSLTSGVRQTEIDNGMFAEIPLHTEQVVEAADRIAESPFHYAAMPQFSLDKIKRITRKYVRAFGVKAIFFDLLKMPEAEASSKEWQELGVLAYGLKSMAMKEDVPVITAVQINREGAQSFKNDGDMDSDNFAGSDRISQAMSVGMVLRIPNKDESDDKENFRVLRVTDNRHGSNSYRCLVSFDAPVIKMTELRRT